MEAWNKLIAPAHWRSSSARTPRLFRRAFVFAVQLQGGAIKGFRARTITLGQAKIAEREIRFRIIRHIRVGALQVQLGERQVIRFEGLASGVIASLSPKGTGRDVEALRKWLRPPRRPR